MNLAYSIADFADTAESMIVAYAPVRDDSVCHRQLCIVSSAATKASHFVDFNKS